MVEKLIDELCPTCRQRRKRINGAWLRVRRERAKVSLREVARRAALSAPFVSDCELNRRRPNARLLSIYEAL